jgi:hypothetical protein
MNKIVVSLAALAALSSVSMASQRSYDLRDVQPWTKPAATVTESQPLAGADNSVPTNFERLTIRAQEREHGDR